MVHQTNAAFTQRSVPGPNKSRRASAERAARRGPTCRPQMAVFLSLMMTPQSARVWADLCDARAIQWRHFRRRKSFSPTPYLVSATGMTEQ